jgi:DNA-binding NtrC family response regulator
MSTVPGGSLESNEVVRTRATSSGRESLRDTVREAKRRVESQLIRDALEQHHWNRRRTAEALQISYRSLMYRMKYCNLRDAAGPASSQE